MVDELSASLSLAVFWRHEVLCTKPCQDQRGVQQMFIEAFDVLKMFHVAVRSRDANGDRCIRTSFAMYNVVSNEHRCVTQLVCYCMVWMFNVAPHNHGCFQSLSTVHGCLTSSLTVHGCLKSSSLVHGAWCKWCVFTYHSPCSQGIRGMQLVSPFLTIGAMCDLEVWYAKMAIAPQQLARCLESSPTNHSTWRSVMTKPYLQCFTSSLRPRYLESSPTKFDKWWGVAVGRERATKYNGYSRLQSTLFDAWCSVVQNRLPTIMDALVVGDVSGDTLA